MEALSFLLYYTASSLRIFRIHNAAWFISAVYFRNRRRYRHRNRIPRDLLDSSSANIKFLKSEPPIAPFDTESDYDADSDSEQWT